MSDDRDRMNLGATGGSPLEGLLGQLMGGGGAGGLGALVDRLRGGGLGDEVSSWVGTGENRPVDPTRLEQAIGPDRIQQFSMSHGIPKAALLAILAMMLPRMIDRMTPQGRVPQSDAEVPAGGIGGVLGSIFGGSLRGMFGGGESAGAGVTPDRGQQPTGADPMPVPGGGLGGLLGGLFGGGGAPAGSAGATEQQISDAWRRLTGGR